MSVLIKGMKMPEHCMSCDLCNPYVDEPYCRRFLRSVPKEGRLKDCPLIEVPTPHGQLIDALKELKRMQSYDFDTYEDYDRAFDILDCAPTVIEAEE